MSTQAVLLALYPAIGPIGVSLTAGVPPGLSGAAIRVQAAAVCPTAANGFFAASAARDIVF